MKEQPMKYRQIVRAISETPWAILPGTLAVILDLVAFRAEGGELSKEEIQARIGSGPSRRGATMAGAVGVLPLYGVIMPKATLMSEISGGTSLDQFMGSFRELMANDQVGSILIDVDSPGGSVQGVPEAAAEIRAARGRKQIVAIANGTMASAAYHIGSQADEIVMTPSGWAGSIGVLATHDDISAMQEKMGVKTTLIYKGEFKTEGNPFEPLDPEARAAVQARVDEFYAMFVGDVAKARGVSVAQVKDGFGQGRMVLAKGAVKEGMADRIATFDETVARLARGGGTAGAARATAVIDGEQLYTLDQARELLAVEGETDPVGDADEVVEDTDSTDSSTLVPGAERLLSRRSFRDAFAQ
jgi:signal peptide peptidase SppA